MLHKTIKIPLPNHRSRTVRLHSIDGKIWSASSARHAARVQIEFKRKRRTLYESTRATVTRFADMLPDNLVPTGDL